MFSHLWEVRVLVVDLHAAQRQVLVKANAHSHATCELWSANHARLGECDVAVQRLAAPDFVCTLEQQRPRSIVQMEELAL